MSALPQHQICVRESLTPCYDNNAHASCRPAECTSDKEKRYGHQHDWPATKHIREPATEWEHRSTSESIGGADPDEVVVAVEVMCNSRKYGRDGGDVEGAEDVADDDSEEAKPESRTFPRPRL